MHARQAAASEVVLGRDLQSAAGMNAHSIVSRWGRALTLGGVLVSPGLCLAEVEPTAPPLESCPPMPDPAAMKRVTEESTGRRVGRIAAEVGAMTATAVGVGMLGASFAVNASEYRDPLLRLPSLEAMKEGFLVGAAIGAPIGVWWGARTVRGRGSLGSVVAGAGLGSGLALLTAEVLPERHENLSQYLLPTFSMAGSLIGYELSNSWALAAEQRSVATVQPIVSMHRSGAALGLAGQF